MLTPPKFINLAKSECKLNIHLDKEVYGQSTIPVNIQEAVCSATWLDCFNYNLDISLLIKESTADYRVAFNSQHD